MLMRTLQRTKKRGIVMVEYAVLLALVCAVAVVFLGDSGFSKRINNVVARVETLFGDEKEGANTVAVRNKQLIELLRNYITEKGSSAFPGATNYNQYYFNNNNGIYDSGAIVFSSTLKGVKNYINNNGTYDDLVNGGGWAATAHQIDGVQYYDIAVYSPEKNNNIKLQDYTSTTQITTDIYRINSQTGQISLNQENATQKVVTRTYDVHTYNVIRSTDF